MTLLAYALFKRLVQYAVQQPLVRRRVGLVTSETIRALCGYPAMGLDELLFVLVRVTSGADLHPGRE